MKIGHIRISTTDQNIARQEVLMNELGVDNVYIDRKKGFSQMCENPLNYVFYATIKNCHFAYLCIARDNPRRLTPRQFLFVLHLNPFKLQRVVA